MSRAKVHRLSEKDIRSAIFRLSNRLRQNRTMIYDFDFEVRTLLIPVMIDPEGAWKRLRQWAITSDQIPTWDAAVQLAKDNEFDLNLWCRAQKWDIEQLHLVYDHLRSLKGELMEAKDA